MVTEIEKKALALVNEVRASHGLTPYENFYATPAALEAICYAIEQHEAFRQEVSDAVEMHCDAMDMFPQDTVLGRFIIAKPDPLVDALGELADRNLEARQAADTLRAAIEKRGGKIVWGEG